MLIRALTACDGSVSVETFAVVLSIVINIIIVVSARIKPAQGYVRNDTRTLDSGRGVVVCVWNTRCLAFPLIRCPSRVAARLPGYLGFMCSRFARWLSGHRPAIRESTGRPQPWRTNFTTFRNSFQPFASLPPRRSHILSGHMRQHNAFIRCSTTVNSLISPR